jgi:hypothetical protein
MSRLLIHESRKMNKLSKKHRRNNVICISIGLGSENLVMNNTSTVKVNPAKIEKIWLTFPK